MNIIIIAIVFTYIPSTFEGYTQESSFLRISQTPVFVDKTLLLKSVFQSRQPLLVTAPPGFGKTTNLDMMKLFLSINNNQTQHQLIHRTFGSLNIAKDHAFFSAHFAHYPVIAVNLKVQDVISLEDVTDQYKTAIYHSYSEHAYLKNSDCEKWRVRCYNTTSSLDVTYGIADLAGMLRHHHGKKVIVLIDDYDSAVNSVLFDVNATVWRTVATLTSGILTTVLKGNADIERIFVTGLTGVSSCGLPAVTLPRYKFLDDHRFLNFYGLTEPEALRLFNKKIFNLNPEQVRKAHELCNGYLSTKGVRIYNTLFVVNFLHRVSTVEVTLYTVNLLSVFQFSELKNETDALLSGGCIDVYLFPEINIRSILHPKYFKEDEVEVHHGLLFAQFVDLGFLSYVFYNESDKDALISLRLPNPQVREVLFTACRSYYVAKYQLRGRDIGNYMQLKNVMNGGARRRRFKAWDRIKEQELVEETTPSISNFVIGLTSTFLNYIASLFKR